MAVLSSYDLFHVQCYFIYIYLCKREDMLLNRMAIIKMGINNYIRYIYISMVKVFKNFVRIKKLTIILLLCKKFCEYVMDYILITR